LIASQPDLDALLNRLQGETEIALDCEFQGEGRYTPLLCLVQVAFGGDAVAIDPLKVDLGPLGKLLADESVVKVFHAGEIDIRLLRDATGHSVRNVFDTQIAAAFVGYGATPAYASLVEKLCEVSLSKRAQFTDWVARPLSSAQIDYALQDVRHLIPMAKLLRAELVRLGRSDWASRATDEMAERAQTPRDRSRLYLRLGPFKEMTPRHLAVLREVATWRDVRAEKLNRPVQTIAPDEALRQLVFDPPRTPEALSRLRGLQRLGDSAGGLLAAIRRGMELPDADCPPEVEASLRDERSDLICSLLAIALRVRANELKIAPSVIGKREHLEGLLAWHDAGRSGQPPEIVQPGSWKKDAAGDLLLSVLDGSVALAVDTETSGGVEITPKPASKSLRP
jgi:ribonuclease D